MRPVALLRVPAFAELLFLVEVFLGLCVCVSNLGLATRFPSADKWHGGSSGGGAFCLHKRGLAIGTGVRGSTWARSVGCGIMLKPSPAVLAVRRTRSYFHVESISKLSLGSV